MSRLLMKTWSCVRLVHPFPVSVVMCASGALLALAVRGLPPAALAVRALAVVALSQISVGALNDYVDRDEDAIVQPEKPIPSGAVSPRTALLMAVISGAALPLVAAGFGTVPTLVISFATAAGIAYDLWLKRSVLSFTAYVVAFLSLVTWIWVIAGRYSAAFVVVYPAGACLLTAAHLANALADIETDRQLGHRGLAVGLGQRRSFGLILLLCMVVAAGVTAGGFWFSDGPALVLSGGSAVLIVLGSLPGLSAHPSRGMRKLAFRLIAPGVALLGIAALLVADRLGL